MNAGVDNMYTVGGDKAQLDISSLGLVDEARN